MTGFGAIGRNGRVRGYSSDGRTARRGVREVALPVVASAVAVTLVTTANGLLQLAVPVLSLGVLYLFAVLPVAAAFGLGYAIGVSLASMIAFNFFFLPPIHTLTLARSADWLALAVYVVTSIVVSDLATRQRRRAREAEDREREAALLAEIAVGLLAHGVAEEELTHIGEVAGAVLGVHGGRITLGDAAPIRKTGETALPLMAAARRVATLTIPLDGVVAARPGDRFLPALASMVAMAVDRERLAGEAAEAEALRRSDAVKTAILRAVSHDLRSPLTAIRVAGDGLAGGSLDLSVADRTDLVETVRTESRRLERIVGNLLDLSRLQVGAATPILELWTADALVEQALAELGERGGSIRVDLAADLPVLRVDAGHVRRALVNLLDNAIGASPAGAPVWIHGVGKGAAVEFRIRDEGPGVPAADSEAAFDPFWRGSGGAHDGAGLGLAIVRGFAEANGGSAWLEPASGTGACFVLALPRWSTAPA